MGELPVLIDHESIQKVMQKQMTRRDFLRHIGLLLLSIFGVSTLINQLLSSDKHDNPKSRRGFGGGKYGA